MRPGMWVRSEGPGLAGSSAHPERARCVLCGRGGGAVAPGPPPVPRCRRCPLRSPSP